MSRDALTQYRLPLITAIANNLIYCICAQDALNLSLQMRSVMGLKVLQNPYLRAVSEPQIVNVQGRPARNGPGSWHEIRDAGASIVSTANITRCTIYNRSLRFLLHSLYLRVFLRYLLHRQGAPVAARRKWSLPEWLTFFRTVNLYKSWSRNAGEMLLPQWTKSHRVR